MALRAKPGLRPRVGLGSACVLSLVLELCLAVEAAGAEPEASQSAAEAPTEPPEPGIDEGAGQDANGEAEPEPEPDADAEPSADAEPGASSAGTDTPPEPDAAGSTSPTPGASTGPSGALPSGHAKTDDVPVDEAQRDEDRRGGRRFRDRERDEGHWQVFAPYPELGPIRYRDPESRRTLWLGADASGTYLPSSLGLADHAVWTVRPAGAWAFALTPWLALGGRHEVAWYDADDRRIRVHGHQVELSSRPLATSRSADALDDRLAVGVTTHAIRWSDEGDTSSAVADLDDTILHLGYGLDHLLGTRWRLGWHVQGRHGWLPQGTQRQVRASTRVAFNPRPAHRLSLDAVGYYVNRDHPGSGGGDALPRHSVHGQLGLGYAWVGRAGVGPWTNVRATTSFLSGEAPVYELREEALTAAYGEVLVGMLARWP
jgi:hypothetical protein